MKQRHSGRVDDREATPAPLLSPASPGQVETPPVMASPLRCPAWPGCQAVFAEEFTRTAHIRRHAHAQVAEQRA